MQRDLLIFPKFKNIDKIQEVRNKYDRLASLVDPHITIVFPFNDEIDTPTLVSKIKECIKGIKKFNVIFQGVNIDWDNYTKRNYIYLGCIEGNDTIVKLHDTIYNNVLPHKLSKDKYVPHITLGHTDSIDFVLDDKFEFFVEKLSIEGIGPNEESIILEEIYLED